VFVMVPVVPEVFLSYLAAIKGGFVLVPGATILTEKTDLEYPGTKKITLSRPKDIEDEYRGRMATAGLSPIRLYDTAFSDYGAGQYTSAITGFEQLIRNFPDAELADDAQFWIGDSLSHLNRLQEAVAAYNLVIQRYPRGDQVDMAYYRRGFTESQLGQADTARATWEEVVKRYPKSQGAELASQRLKGLSRSGTAPGKQ